LEYKYGKINYLNRNLKKNGINEETRKIIMESGELVNSKSSLNTKVEWCFNAMNKMDKLFDKNIKQNIREGCACNLGGKRGNYCREINKKYETIEDRIKTVNESHYIFGHEIKIIGNGKYKVTFWEEPIIEPKCSCFPKIKFDKEWSESWCYCCGGHVKHHLEIVLGKKVVAKIISSALMSQGKKNCIFELNEV